MKSDLDINTNGKNRVYAIHLPSRSVSMHLILNVFSFADRF